MDWHVKTFEELNTTELYLALKLRTDVFVVEQDCAYPELDGKDSLAGVRHIFAKTNNEMACYLRVMPPGCSYPEMSSLGRVATHADYRGQGLGHQLMQRAMRVIDQHWPDFNCHISAQSYLTDYYAQYGFEVVGEEYLEDGIPHIGMERQAALKAPK